jgi:hypothetical protein
MAASGIGRIRSQGNAQRISDANASRAFIGILVATLGIFGWWVSNLEPISDKAIIADEAGKPRSISNVFMAGTLCKKQAALSFQGDVVQSIIDHHSTRYDRPRDLFVVLLMVSVYETGKTVDEYRAHCHVVPNETEVNYFRGFTVTPNGIF